MNQKDIHRAVAQRTGETVSTIRHLGFNLEHDPTNATTKRVVSIVLDFVGSVANRAAASARCTVPIAIPLPVSIAVAFATVATTYFVRSV